MAKDKTTTILENEQFAKLNQKTEIKCTELTTLEKKLKELENEKLLQQNLLDSTQSADTRKNAAKDINKIDKQIQKLKDTIGSKMQELSNCKTVIENYDQQLQTVQNNIDAQKKTIEEICKNIDRTQESVSFSLEHPSTSAQFTLTLPDAAGASAPVFPDLPPPYSASNYELQPEGSNNSTQECTEQTGYLAGLLSKFGFHSDHASQ